MKLFPSRGPGGQNQPADPARGGFALLETMIATILFVVVGYTLLMSSRASNQSQRTVVMNVASNGEHRETTRQLRDELRSAQFESLSLIQPVPGTATISFQTALASNGGAPRWGVFDRRLSADEDLCSREDWTVQYAVEQGGLEMNELVRRVNDPSGSTQLMHTLVANVVDFTVDDSGDVWVVHLETLGEEGRRIDEFDVRIRNQ